MDRDFIVNSPFFCCTQNYFDNGRRYYFFIENGNLFYQREGDPIKPFTHPYADCSIVKLAADNNRVFVLTENKITKKRELYWCCIIKDHSIWVDYIFTVADILTSSNQTIEDEEAEKETDTLIRHFINNIDLFENLINNSLEALCTLMNLPFDDKLKQHTIDAIAEIKTQQEVARKKDAVKRLLDIIFTYFIKQNYNGELYFQDKKLDTNSTFDQWTTIYNKWVEESHQPFKWNKIKREHVKAENLYLFRKNEPSDLQTNRQNEEEENFEFSLHTDDITGIAVGNWYQTVATFYVQLQVDKALFQRIFNMGEEDISPGDDDLSFSDGRPVILLYIDEEPIMHWWKIVPGKINMPYPLSSKSRINAAHSVINVLKKVNNIDKIFWVRFDYHNYKDFAWFPLNWTEIYYNEWLDVDTFRLYLSSKETSDGFGFFKDTLLPKIFNFLFNKQKDEAGFIQFLNEMQELFKEITNHHPGWHCIDNPVKNSEELHIKVTKDNPWPVPSINSFMSLLLNVSQTYKSDPKENENMKAYISQIDTILEMLKMLYSSALGKVKKRNKIDDIIQNLGFLGENPAIPSYNYPVQFIVKENRNSYKISSIPRAIDTHLILWEFMQAVKKYAFKASNKKYVCLPEGRGNRLYTKGKSAEGSAVFAGMRLDYNIIVLQANNGNYIGIKNIDNPYVVAEFNVPGTWEAIKIIPRDIVIRANNGNLARLIRHSEKSYKLIADKNTITRESMFIMDEVGDHIFTIKSGNKDWFLNAPVKKGFITADANTKLSGSPFTFHRLGFDKWAIQTKNGFYLGVQNENMGVITAGPKEIGTNEIFTISPLTVLLQTSNKKYIRRKMFKDELVEDRRRRSKSLLFQIEEV